MKPPPPRPAIERGDTLDEFDIDETVEPSPDDATAPGPVKEGRLYGTKATCAAGSTLKHRLFGRT